MDIPKSWTFDRDDVAAGFDAHVRQQLPWYDLATGAIVHLARHYLTQGGHAYDIGCATGNIGRALGPLLAEREATLMAVDRSKEMLALYEGPGVTFQQPVEEITDFLPFDFAVSMLTLVFLPPTQVAQVLNRLTYAMNPGGALVIVERMLPAGGYPSLVTTRLGLAAKRAAGAPDGEILDKELSLAGAQRPLDPQMMTSRGAIEWFRFGDFAGWLIEKGAV